MSRGPALVLAGYGVGDALQLTLEAQQALVRATAVYAIAPPERLVRYLSAQRLTIVDLAPRLREGAPVEAYLDVAGFILREAVLDPPVGLLVPGNPLFLNSISRFLLQAARERDMDVALYPGVSVVDALISDLGLDVTARGLQVYDARHLLALEHAINPGVPLFALQMGGLAEAAAEHGLDAEAVHDAFAAHLRRFYPGDHPLSLILTITGRGQFRHVTCPLGAFRELVPHLEGSAALFCDIVRPAQGVRPAQSAAPVQLPEAIGGRATRE